MTKEEKQLLLKDLAARLPYGVKADHFGTVRELLGIIPSSENVMVGYDINDYEDSVIEDIKPYLRPMSSMTEGEKKELKCLFDAENITNDSICFLEGGTLEEYEAQIPFSFCSKLIDWLNVHHFDYCGLIEKGLAIEITKENNPYEK